MNPSASHADVELVTKNVVDRVFSDVAGRAPWTSQVEWAPEVRLAPDRVAAAAAATVAAHPLLGARQGPEPGAWSVPHMPGGATVVCYVLDSDEAVTAARGAAVSEGFDLGREGPVRFHLLRGPDSDRLLVVADHAVMDGIGVGRAMLTFQQAYAAGTGTAPVDTAWRAVQPLTCAVPSDGHVDAVVGRLQAQARPTPVRLAPDAAAEGKDGCYGVVYHDLSPAAQDALASLSSGAATPGGATANDAVVAAVCLAGMAWNRAHGAQPLPYAVGVPVNLRPARAWFDGVCNATLAWPVRLDDETPVEVLRQVSEQVARARLGLYSSDVRAVLAYLGRSVPLPVRARHALATTTMVSTVPVPDGARSGLAAGPLRGGAPTSAAMGITFAAAVDGGVWRLSARYLRSRWSNAGAAGLLANADAEIVRLCQAAERRLSAGWEEVLSS